MKTLFYYIVEIITEKITGLENGAIKIYDLGRYLRTTEIVIDVLNGSIAIIILGVVAYYIYNNIQIKKLNNRIQELEEKG